MKDMYLLVRMFTQEFVQELGITGHDVMIHSTEVPPFKWGALCTGGSAPRGTYTDV
jgi:hypothetical protein